MRRGLWLWVVIGCALLLHGTFLAQRAALEAHNDTVELVVDGGGLFAVAERTDLSVAQLLTRWQQIGVGAVAVGELSSLEYESTEQYPAVPNHSSMSSARQLDMLPGDVRIVPRSLAAAAAAWTRGFDVGPFVPEGDVVADYPNGLESFVGALDEMGLAVGVVEFVDTVGVKEVLHLLDYDAVFVHSIPPGELVKLTDGQAVARFHRAVLERQARLLYIHPLWDEDAAPAALLTRNDAYIEAIVAQVHRAGLQLGAAVPLPAWSTSVWGPLAAGVAAMAGLLLLVGRLRPLPLLVEIGSLAAGGLVVLLLLTVGRDVLARQAAALAVTLVFPALAVGTASSVVDRRRSGGGESAMEGRSGSSPGPLTRAGRVFLGLLIVLSVTAAGITIVAGTLSDSRFLLKLEQFRGVKLAHVVPFGLLAVMWSFGSGQKPDVARWRVAFRWKHVLLGVVVLACGFVFVARTGHDLLPVSQLERGLREWLETALPVRPRTKEFLLGYPALLVGLMLASGDRRRWAPPWLIAGAIVPVSVLNSFAHAHVPLTVSIVRSWYGLLLGGAVAVVAGGIVMAVSALLSRNVRGKSAAEVEAHR